MNTEITRLAIITSLNKEADYIHSANTQYWQEKVYTYESVGSYQMRYDRLEEIRRELCRLKNSPAQPETR